MSNPDGHLLTATERLEFAATITRKVIIQTETATSEPAVEAACFVPHHFFRYFDADGTKIGEVKVCFCCERARSYPTIFETGRNEYNSYDIAAIGRFVSSLDLPIDIHCPEGSYFQ